MAIYSANISNCSRGKGSSAQAHLAYISGREIEEERTGERYKYGREERIMHTGTLLPEGAPEAWEDPAVMFNDLDKIELAANARTGKKIMLALPREFDLERQIQVVESFLAREILARGYAATYAIHTDKDNNNPHAHILIPNRQIEKGEFVKVKSRKEYALDERGNKIPVIDPETGQQKVRERAGKGRELLWQRVTVSTNPLDKKEVLRELRAAWARECNRHLAPDLHIDHRSNAERGIEEEPTIHEGYAARQIELRGAVSERAEINREIRERNGLLQKIKDQLKELAAQLKDLMKGGQQHERIGNLLARRDRALDQSGRGTAGREREPKAREPELDGEAAFRARQDRDAKREAEKLERERLAAERGARLKGRGGIGR